MVAMIAGFISNIILDYLFVWVWNQGAAGAALATVIGQGVTMLMALAYLLRRRKLTLRIRPFRLWSVADDIIKVGLAPFGLAMTPNISLIIINRFSMAYDGEPAVATYACIAYIICIIYLILQGVGDESQPLMSQHHGERDTARLRNVRRMAYRFAMALSVLGCVVMYVTRGSLGTLFGASAEVNAEIARIMPIFLVSVPFVAITRITTASFYATEKSALSYILTFIEPVLMLILMLILPPLLALVLKRRVDRQDLLT